MHHHYLGGRETFQADRDAAEQVLAALPGMRAAAVAARAFAGRAVRFLAADADIGQFLDLGAGLPAAPAVHEVAERANPAARTAYVDYDPVVVSHGNALLARPGVAIVIRGDLHRPAELLALPELRAHLDFGRPVGVLLISVLQFIADADDPYAIVAAIRDALAPGSFLVLSHAGPDLMADSDTVRRVIAALCPREDPVDLDFVGEDREADRRVKPVLDAEVPQRFPRVLWLVAEGVDRSQGGHHPHVRTIEVHGLPARDEVAGQGRGAQEREMVVLAVGVPGELPVAAERVHVVPGVERERLEPPLGEFRPQPAQQESTSTGGPGTGQPKISPYFSAAGSRIRPCPDRASSSNPSGSGTPVRLPSAA
jgi:SAM-dependent methyltransferase